MTAQDKPLFLGGNDTRDYSSNRVAIGMSGGVDSSIAAMMLRDAGFDVLGITMDIRSGAEKNYERFDAHAAEEARAVADGLGIPHRVIDLHDAFKSDVIDDFTGEYLRGRTPNPCVRCNRYIKWRALAREAERLEYPLLATGHYARIVRGPDGTHTLACGADASKDQSYFLWGIGSTLLARTLFPLGGMTKEDVRLMAHEHGIASARRRDSQEICFIPDDDYRRYLTECFADSPPKALTEGAILSRDGEILGRHRGSAFYTIGQRRGTGIALGHPVYVTAIDTSANTITVGDESDLYAVFMRVTGIVWAGESPPGEAFTCRTKVRYRSAGTTARVTPNGSSAYIEFEKPQRAVTPGQSAVFYDGCHILGGGIIEDVSRAD